MTVWNIQFVKSPPFERPHHVGFNVCVQVDDQSPGEPALCWRSELQRMDWMQDPPIHEIRRGPPARLSAEIARSILSSIRSATLCIAAPGHFGYIHPTRFRLFIESGFTASKVEWVEALPKEWAAIEDAVKTLTALGEGVAPRDA